MPTATEIITLYFWWILVQNISTKHQDSNGTLTGSCIVAKWDLSKKFADVSVLKSPINILCHINRIKAINYLIISFAEERDLTIMKVL